MTTGKLQLSAMSTALTFRCSVFNVRCWTFICLWLLSPDLRLLTSRISRLLTHTVAQGLGNIIHQFSGKFMHGIADSTNETGRAWL